MDVDDNDVKDTKIDCKGRAEEAKATKREASRRGRRPGRKPNKLDMKAKLERSRQSARECRARKKLRYQYLEDLVNSRENAVLMLRKELELYREWCKELDEGRIPEGIVKLLEDQKIKQEQLADQSQD